MTAVLLAAGGSFIVAGLGAMLGVGGGTFLVPFLVFFLDIPALFAVSLSTFVVLGTSIGGAASALRSGRANVGLALLLEPGMLAGAVGAALLVQRTPPRLLLGLFGGLLVGLAALIFWLDRVGLQKGPVPPSGPPRFFDGRIPGAEDEDRVVYRPQHPRILAAASFLSGSAAGFFGIGGGVLNVPMLVLLARVPIEAAAPTSVLTLSVTGAAAGALHLAHGTVPGVLTAACVIAAVPGARGGARLALRVPRRALQRAFVVLALLLGVSVLLRALGVL